MKPVISVIVPVFNAESYLENCIKSILKQSFRGIEVIAIDDGSSDKSGMILDRLAATDRRLRVFHQKNQGVSAARNLGLNVALGQYVAFCDADDWMEYNMLELMLQNIELHNCDWVMCNVTVEEDGKKGYPRLTVNKEYIDYSSSIEHIIVDLLRFRFDNANWNKLYKKSIISKYKLKFDDRMFVWEDLLFNLQYASISKSIYCINECLYHYRISNNTLTSKMVCDAALNYSLLYLGYLNFAKKYVSEQVWVKFREEIGRGCYYHLLDKITDHIKQRSNGFKDFVLKYRYQLLQFEPDIFFFPKKANSIVSRIKQWMLMRKHFFLFATLTWFSLIIHNYMKRH